MIHYLLAFVTHSTVPNLGNASQGMRIESNSAENSPTCYMFPCTSATIMSAFREEDGGME
jgi:hypothetical protein